MVRDAALIVLSLSMVTWIGYMIISDRRQARELAAFHERLAARAAPPWQATVVDPELPEGEGYL